MPNSAWNKLDGFPNNSAAFCLLLLLVTLVFTAVAQKITKTDWPPQH